MENASKALIIAGAILISILLISVGIIIMNAINNPVDQAATSADEYSIQQFNAKFVKYDGVQKGSTLSNLTSEVTVSNAQDEEHVVDLNLPAGIASSGRLTKTRDYDVTIGYNEQGYINAITVTALETE